VPQRLLPPKPPISPPLLPTENSNSSHPDAISFLVEKLHHLAFKWAAFSSHGATPSDILAKSSLTRATDNTKSIKCYEKANEAADKRTHT